MLKDVLIRNLHKVMRKDPLINELLGSVGQSLDSVRVDIHDTGNQVDIDKATWGLTLIQRELGIPIQAQPIDEQRAVVKSKLRGSGTIGAAQIKLVADAYTNGQVEVGFENGAVIIRFTSVVGVPPNIEDVKKTLRDIIPAHLLIEFAYLYLTIREINNVMTINQLSNTKLNQFAPFIGV
ncbi:hypothetical protein SAMN05444162_3463 [Paenibacillaceae bacterium GAS479]|nr:hypothetical protein SAMN05444162_3463 [Paenibacillaceae bacterium GAS479]